MLTEIARIPFLGIPIHGYGLMLFAAYLVTTWLLGRAAVRNGSTAEMIERLALWIFGFGIVGGRLFFVLQYYNTNFRDRPMYHMFAIWEGGLVIYGAVFGALLGVILFCRRERIRLIWLLDLLTPYLGVGYALGRIGCLLNGCCFGDYCQQPWGLSFPPGSPPHLRLVQTGVQSRLGFAPAPNDTRVLYVEPDSDADRQGLRVGDRIVKVNGTRTEKAAALQATLAQLREHPPNGDKERDPDVLFARSLRFRDAYLLTVERQDGALVELRLSPAWSLPLQPSQIYSAINGLVLSLLLVSIYPHRGRDGVITGMFCMGYAVLRFLVEFLRSDEAAFANGLTISQNISIGMLIVGLALVIHSLRRPTASVGPHALNQAERIP